MRTRVGYAGGTTESPTYRSIGDHTEALQLDFDPTVISYERLLEFFWQNHEPCGRAWSRQYQAILFFADDAQERAAKASAAKVREAEVRVLRTEVVPFTKFWVAEDYHQKYALRQQREIMAQLRPLFATEAEFRESPLTAKLNAYAAGDLGFRDLQTAVAELGFEALGNGSLAGVRRRP
ncbi:MAG: peptide-methionine (S)-S-oxide reductase [Planctomycetes bacterium]|nr:peptide-methionine (S)-S-oxide reductase [Planctomycetota bacterium]